MEHTGSGDPVEGHHVIAYVGLKNLQQIVGRGLASSPQLSDLKFSLTVTHTSPIRAAFPEVQINEAAQSWFSPKLVS